MKKNKRNIAAALVVGCTAFGPSLVAEPINSFDLERMVNAGLGCLKGDVHANLEEVDGDTILVLSYDGFSASAGTTRTDRKSCLVRIPTNVPAGMRLVLSRAETIGHANVSSTGSGSAAASIALSTGDALVVTQDLAGPVEGDFVVESPAGSIECDRSSDESILGVTLVALIQERNRQAESVVNIEKTRLVFHLEACAPVL